MIRRKHQQILLAASLYSWMLLLVLPFINGQINNGTEWVQLCTQSGLKLVPIESGTSDSHSTFHSLDCPCLSHGIQSVEVTLSLPVYSPVDAERAIAADAVLAPAYFLPPLRAPPLV